MSRASSIPALTGFGFKNSCRPSRIPVKLPASEKSTVSSPLSSSNLSSVTNSLNSSSLGRNISGSTTPSGMQTPRKGSVEATTGGGTSAASRKSRGTTPIHQREPFRL